MSALPRPRLTRRVAAALERDEWQRAPTTLPTARPWAVVSALIEFPSSVEGIRIVDVGAGGSDAVATLLEAGADAFAVDPRYRSLPDLIWETTAYFRVQEAIGQLPQASEPSARPIAAQRTAFEHFVSSFQSPAAQNHYVPAVATRLPFGS